MGGKGEYVVYAPRGGTVRLDLRQESGKLVSTWLNPITGARAKGKAVEGGATRTMESPWEEAVLHLSRGAR